MQQISEIKHNDIWFSVIYEYSKEYEADRYGPAEGGVEVEDILIAQDGEDYSVMALLSQNTIDEIVSILITQNKAIQGEY